MEDFCSITFSFNKESDDIYININLAENMSDEDIEEKMTVLMYGINTGMFADECVTALASKGETGGREKVCQSIIDTWRSMLLEHIASTAKGDINSDEPCIKPSDVFRLRIN